ncbi:hypothetical protein HI914_07016 [Erysiphe necator]|nr:hypothetical protein HI914_07016 [Erysiphe necator]
MSRSLKMARMFMVLLLFLFSNVCLSKLSDSENEYGIHIGWAKCNRRYYSFEDIKFSVKKACERLKSMNKSSKHVYNKLLEYPQNYPIETNIWGLNGPFYTFSLHTKSSLNLAGSGKDRVIINEDCRFASVVMKMDNDSPWTRFKQKGISSLCFAERKKCVYSPCGNGPRSWTNGVLQKYQSGGKGKSKMFE